MAAARALGCMAHGLRNQVIRAPAAKRVICHAKQLCCVKQQARNIQSPRFISSTSFCRATGDKETNVEEEIKEPPNWVSNLFGYTKPESETQLVSEEEKKEREQMFEQVADMYFAKPRQYPSIEFYEKAVDMLVKYNDDHGVEVIWRLMEEMNIEPPEELICKMEDFIGKAREAAWFK